MARIFEFCEGNYRSLLLLILAAAAALRIYLAMSSTFIHDEHFDWLSEASRISFDPENLHLPVRTDRHGALSAYFMKFGWLFLPESHIGWRWTAVLAGVLCIWGAAAIANDLFGKVAALAAAALLAFNEFHIVVSTFAIQLPYYLAFS